MHTFAHLFGLEPLYKQGTLHHSQLIKGLGDDIRFLRSPLDKNKSVFVKDEVPQLAIAFVPVLVKGPRPVSGKLLVIFSGQTSEVTKSEAVERARLDEDTEYWSRVLQAKSKHELYALSRCFTCRLPSRVHQQVPATRSRGEYGK